jgi:hypothetical protein
MGGVMKVFRRSLYSWVALMGFVFSQLAVSAYACPLWGELSQASEPMVMMDGGDMAGMHCPEMGATNTDTNVTALCVQHCEQGSQAVGSNPALDFHPALFVLPFAALLSQPEFASVASVPAPLLARATSPPPLWRTGRLRI